MNLPASSNNSNTTFIITPTILAWRRVTRSWRERHPPARLRRPSITTETELEDSEVSSLPLLPSLLTTRPTTVKTGQVRPPLTITATRPAAVPVTRAQLTLPVTTTTTIQEMEETLSATTQPTRSSTQVSTKLPPRLAFTRNRCRVSVIFSRHKSSSPVQLENRQTILASELIFIDKKQWMFSCGMMTKHPRNNACLRSQCPPYSCTRFLCI